MGNNWLQGVQCTPDLSSVDQGVRGINNGHFLCEKKNVMWCSTMRGIVPVWCKIDDNGLAIIYDLPSKRLIKKWQPYDIWDSLSNLFRRALWARRKNPSNSILSNRQKETNAMKLSCFFPTKIPIYPRRYALFRKPGCYTLWILVPASQVCKPFPTTKSFINKRVTRPLENSTSLYYYKNNHLSTIMSWLLGRSFVKTSTNFFRGLLGTHPLLLGTHPPNFFTLRYLFRKLSYLKLDLAILKSRIYFIK